eukprot:NODE_40_length_29852_cov_0.370215.p6 type:complete len:422 gc:universal NODE_40_length_29852_cov_0.370215:26132-27397(+)
MGIQGLLNSVKSIQQPFKISSIKGKRVAVDAFGWLHLALYPCAEDIYYNREYMQKMVKYFMQRVTRLIQHDIDVLIVFDGMRLPAKLNTHSQRNLKIQESLDNAKRNININMDTARKNMQSAVKVNSLHVLAVQKELKIHGIKFIVAPFEADAQLSYLCINKYVDYVITEDSDLLVYGCPKIIYKLDKIQQGQGILVELKDLGNVKEMNFKNWTRNEFRTFCILCGCDYLDNIKNIGPKKANQLVNKFRTLEKIIYNIRAMKSTVPAGYFEQFKKIEKLFVFQYVFDLKTKQVVHLNNVPDCFKDEVRNWELGTKLTQKEAMEMCFGKTSPLNYQPQAHSQAKQPPESLTSISLEKRVIVVCPLDSNLPKKRHYDESLENEVPKSNAKLISSIEFREMTNPIKKAKKRVPKNPFFEKWLGK